MYFNPTINDSDYSEEEDEDDLDDPDYLRQQIYHVILPLIKNNTRLFENVNGLNTNVTIQHNETMKLINDEIDNLKDKVIKEKTIS